MASHLPTMNWSDPDLDEELHERLIELIIASTPHEAFRNELYSKPQGCSLAEVLTEGRKHEALTAGNLQLHQLEVCKTEQKERVDAIIKGRGRLCQRCGSDHKPRQCPAFNDICHLCGYTGHWAKCCRNRKQQKKTEYTNQHWRDKSQPQSMGRYHRKSYQSQSYKNDRKKPNKGKIDAIQTTDSSEDDPYQREFHSVTVSEKCMHSIDAKMPREEAYTILNIKPPDVPGQKHTLRLKIDTGASGNTLPLRTYRQMYGRNRQAMNRLQKSHAKLSAYSGHRIRCYGKINIPCQWKHSEWINAMFYVVDVPGPAIVGLPTCEALNLVTVNVDSIANVSKAANKENKNQTTTKPKKANPLLHINTIEDLKKAYANQFDKLGNFSGTAKLLLKEGAEPFQDPPRKCSIHIKDKLKKELDNLVEQDVICKVEVHTDWCSSLAYSTKKDGSLRICLDPKKLNDSLKRCPHRIPTVEELNPKFANAKVFSKLDAKAGYWSIHLDEDSQLLTTFRTPFGRYCWKRLPFGLSVSQDIFQAKMDQILEGLQGVVSIADDIAVYGKNEEEHDKNLINLMERAANTGLVFNSEKCNIKQNQISFFGNQYTANGIRPDPAKVRDIQKMPTPQNKDELHRFIGMLSYLSPYIPRFADKAHTLRGLLKNDTPWVWDTNYQNCFDDLKTMITEDACLKYYDPSLTITLEVDASQKGLGVALVQNNQPIAFGSKTLTDTQSRYSNIEREMLAIVYGIQRYHTYLYGKGFIVITDHKPLVTICRKPLHAAPPRLQRMLVQVQGYNFEVMYRPGPQMVLADTLSRLPNPENSSEIELDERIDGLIFEPEDPEMYTIALINFSPDKQNTLRAETSKDLKLSALKEVILQGWPEKIQDLPKHLRAFWAFRDELGIETGVIFKGRQVLIPDSMTESILKQLHSSHQGIEKTRRLARESVYWIKMNDDIEKMCRSCSVCIEYQDANPKEPLQPHKVPTKPWQSLASDLFEVNGRHYLLTVDRYSKFPMVDEMHTTSSHAVAQKIQAYVSLFGRPDEILTDNGTQYTGEAFKRFTKEWGVKHITSSPHYPKSNGFIERHVRHIKSIVKKTLKYGGNLQMALLQIRATPIDSKLPSPAELIFGRPVTTLLPSRTDPGKEEHRLHLEQRTANMKEHHDRNSRKELPPLQPGQHVTVLNKERGTWHPATVVEKSTEPRSYIVQTPNGNQIRRCRSHLRELFKPHIQINERRNQIAEAPQQTQHQEDCNDSAETITETPCTTNTNYERQNSPPPTCTRSGRVINKPSRYKDFDL
uniref:Gypsy retrotransposon integrase-like protein 1 n=1 Tax=Oryzias sinensis TaxID=183150 RepID=A0A8C7WXQ6_9TELE